MINILVVEDEPPILRNICKKIQQLGPDFNIAATAYNGQDAIDILKSTEIDVVFTDISMPIMDGLALAKLIYEYYSHVPCVILTGYQEFSYAHTAIRYGVYDYLLKPLELKSLRELLGKLQKKILEERITSNQTALLRAFYNTDIPISLNKTTVHDNLYILLFCAGSYPMGNPDYLGPARNFWDTNSLDKFLPLYFGSDDFYFVLSDHNFSCKFIIFSVADEHNLPKKIKLLYNNLSSSSFPITGILGTKILEMNQIKECINQLNGYLTQVIRFGEGALILSMDTIASTTIEFMLDEYREKKLIYALEQNNYNYFEKEIFEISDILSANHLSQVKLLDFLSHLTFLCRKYNSSIHHLTSLDHDIKEMVSNQYTYKALFNNFLALIKEGFEKTEYSYGSESKSHLIEQIINYVEENISRPITNQLLSEYFGLVPSYISKLFKTQVGLTPSEYLLRLRIEKAKELLVNSETEELLVKDVAEIVGYSDPLYFSRVFKKETGIYPSRYKGSLKK